MRFAGPCSSSATCPTSKDLLPTTKGTTSQRTPNAKYRTSFCPKSLDQNKNQVHPILCEGVSLHWRWNCLRRHKVIYPFFHSCSQFLIIVHDRSFLFLGIRTLKSLHWVSFQQVRTDVHARNSWLPPPGPSVPAGIFLHYLSCEKSKKILFLQTLEDFIISILPPIIGDLDSTRVVVEVFSKSTFITWQSCEV